MSKIIGTCLGEYVKEEDVFYDPLTDIYKIKAGDRLVEIDGHALQSESLRTLQEALSNVDDENIKIDMLGSWAKARSNPTYIDSNSTFIDTQVPYTAKEITDKLQEAVSNLSSKTSAAGLAAGAPFDSQSQDPLRARVEAAGAYVRPADPGSWSVRFTDKAAEKLRANSVYGLGSAQAHTSAPWDDPLAADLTKAQNTVACIDMPDYRPDYNPNARVDIYYHDRFPSIPFKSIIEDAIELLNKNKNLHISKISLHNEKFSNYDISLTFSADHPTSPGLRKVLEVLFTHTAFDRAYKTDLDKNAGLRAKLDTNTYMKLRIAFLLYEALKLNDADAKKIHLDIFRIFASDTRPNFHI